MLLNSWISDVILLVFIEKNQEKLYRNFNFQRSIQNKDEICD